MTISMLRKLTLSTAILAAACSSSSTGPSNSDRGIAGTYQLQTVRGSSLPVPLFGQCSLGATQPCSVCSESAASGTLTLKNEPHDFSLSLVSSGVCVDPLSRSPTSASSHTNSLNGSWSTSGSSGVTFTSNNMNLASASISGSTLSTSFNWLNPDPGGQPAQVTAVFAK
jgi:hypothetical protein